MKIFRFFLLGATYAYNLPTATFSENISGAAKIGCDTGRIRVVRVRRLSFLKKETIARTVYSIYSIIWKIETIVFILNWIIGFENLSRL